MAKTIDNTFVFLPAFQPWIGVKKVHHGYMGLKFESN